MTTLFQWTTEIMLMIAHFPLSFVLPFLNWSPQAGRADKPTIILVERWIKRNPLHVFPKKFFERLGYSVHSVNFPMLETTFDQSARELRDYIDSHSLRDIVLIGLSNGGVTSYEYLQKYNGWKNTRLLITIGSPFGGAILGFLLFGSHVKQELDPQGAFVTQLREQKPLHPENIYCFGARVDQMVGSTNCYLPGVHHIEIDVVGHNLLHTLWKPTFEKIHTIITATPDATQR